MVAKKKTKTKKTVESAEASNALADVIVAEQENIRREREEYSAKYKPFKRKQIIANPEALVDTVHKIAEWSGVGEMSPGEVHQVSEFISTGQLHFTDRQLRYELKNPVKRGDEKVRTLSISEASDNVLEGKGVEAFQIGMLYVLNRRDEIASGDMRSIVSAAVGLEPEVVGRMGSRDIMAVYSLYMIFFLGR